ncbi:MAG TPA: ATP-binding protein [Anaerolineae bacterium]|nr:ATP-binding protein [Anaerolineae bacterium]
MSSPGVTERSRLPTTGMRGGLGRTLLTAFLILAIVPLSTISWYATQRERRDIQSEVTAKLSSAAAMMEAQVRQWVEVRIADLALLAALPATQESTTALVSADHSRRDATDASTAHDLLRAQLHALLAQDPAFRRLAVLDSEGWVLVSTDPQTESSSTDEPSPTRQKVTLDPEQTSILRCMTIDPASDAGMVVIQRIAGPDDGTLGLVAGWLNMGDLVQTMETVNGLGETGEIYLVDSSGTALPQGQTVASSGIRAALSGVNSEGLQKNYAGVPVIGVYRWMPDLELALVAEQAQEEAFAATDTVTAAVVGATLVVALVTAVIAAVVTRQITRPIVQLTESALRIAGGDMEQRVPVTSRDEIGILAYVFNRMATELKTLYDDLEEKVAQRTALLQKANYHIQRRAIQLATTVEVSQAATSILEPDQLLREVVLLVHDRFAYPYVGIYLLDDEGKQALLQEERGGSEEMVAVKAKPVPIEDGSAVGQAALTGKPAIVRQGDERSQAALWSPYIRAEAALPLRMGDQIIGVLDILSTDHDDFDADDVSVLQNVANQITIALENARAYAVEREAAKRLRELDRSKRRFLANMSHELRTPLTNITGFSRLMLKGIDGPLTGQLQNDIEIIYHNSQHLLGLINDLLDISHIEAGLMELEFREVNLAELIHSVMATASALVRDKDTELCQEIAPDLPQVQADAARIRQVLLRLLANAAKFTEQGIITVRSWRADEQVLVSVSDTGVGIPAEDQDRIFEQFEQGSLEDGRRPYGAGLGLALSKEFVEMHGGRIWVESEAGQGSTFTFSLPLRPHG